MNPKLRCSQSSKLKVEETLAPATSQHPPSVRYPGGVRLKGHAVFFAPYFRSQRGFRPQRIGTFSGSQHRTQYDIRAGAWTKMTRQGQSTALALIVAALLTGILPGCATMRKCGLSGCPGDAEITAQVNALLAQHPALEAPNLLHVQTLDHVVYLYGLVDTDYQRLLAQSVALKASGVSKVVNSIGLNDGR
jgi:osmotically-inducible protein OsmY